MKLSKNYALDIDFLYKYRQFKDGITFFQLEIDLDLYKDDHKPEAVFRLIIMNLVIFDFDLYNIHHLEHE